ncbi:MAG: TIGR03905 family TSCPD domain-containing protein [Clostridia bacterium]|nr:TIGR03905 family TSCPD domain-containing protein [Clostridia bacterium]
MKYSYKTKGTCSSAIDFEIEDGILHNVRYTGGCNGNLKAIGLLTEGADAREIANKLRGNTCGFRNTSCADQLACAIEKALSE